jgi:lysophospholipase L1-like esterase
MGLRGPERQPGALKEKVVVEAFGGSTTYDIEVADGETWPEMLEKTLGADRYAVLNHGVPAYSTVENVIQTAFYEAPYGEAPRCALYYVGWNDLRSIHLPGLDPGYADNHLLGQVDALQVRRLDGPMHLASPLLTLIGRLVVLGLDTARPAPKPEGGNRTDPDPVLEAIFARNVHTISAINRQRGIRTIWVGQIANRELLATGTSGRRMTFVAETDLWTVLQWFLGVLKREALAAGDLYVELPNDRFTNADFVDTDHFRAAGSRKFAELLAPSVAEACGGAAPGGR